MAYLELEDWLNSRGAHQPPGYPLGNGWVSDHTTFPITRLWHQEQSIASNIFNSSILIIAVLDKGELQNVPGEAALSPFLRHLPQGASNSSDVEQNGQIELH